MTSRAEQAPEQDPDRDEFGNFYGDDPRIAAAEQDRDYGRDY